MCLCFGQVGVPCELGCFFLFVTGVGKERNLYLLRRVSIGPGGVLGIGKAAGRGRVRKGENDEKYTMIRHVYTTVYQSSAC